MEDRPEMPQSWRTAYLIFFYCWRLMTRQPLWTILCHLPEIGRIEIVEEMKEGQVRREDEWQTSVKKQKHSPSTLTCCKDSRALPKCKPISVGCPGNVRHTTLVSSNHPLHNLSETLKKERWGTNDKTNGTHEITKTQRKNCNRETTLE